MAATSRDLPPLYRQWAEHYRQAIAKGALSAGQRMPSVRELMQRHAISLSTALQILRTLEAEGCLEARPRVGYFVCSPAAVNLGEATDPDPRMPVSQLDGKEFVGINERISLWLEQGRLADVRIDLGSAMPAPELFDGATLNRHGAALLREFPDILVQGHSRPGTHPVFQAAMARRALDAGVQVAPQEVMATLGNSEAVNLALSAVAERGDVIAVESPTFYGLLQAVEAQNLRALEIPSSARTGISLEALELAVQQEPRLKAVVVVPHLQMPHGAVMPDEHKARLVDFCVRHQLALIEDDIYREFLDSPQPPRPLKAWDRHGQVIYCVSFNKTVAPGLRQGWMNGGRWHTRIHMLKFAKTRNMQVWAQLLTARTVEAAAHERHLRRLRQALRQQRERSVQAVARYFPVGTRLSVPAGGLSLWIELPPGASSSRLFEQALALGIRVAPGPMFSNTGRYERFVRLSCGLPFSAEVEAAYVTLGRLVQAMLDQDPLQRVAA
ncbi:PLP-dependent aminotransferase family protein [Curvibacter sp. HBC61]|uniref:PLP-dependent aminotransferase family protein n=1 Tax=Curvibacter cyanobacteriorum TaxID=3026422 RepID=A0ABT5N367_9BURK|nr:PLP-dependent aminotransferase family protein [Curvibacter sp. HBC61]MDD0840527.1 PLP-dependent aminotransferase family protein [Curvibacter sp. HBC61]